MLILQPPPKEKRFIVVGFHEDQIHLTSVLINTEINFRVNCTPELASQHMEFKCDQRPYLTHDSFIDCSEIHSLDKNALIKKIDEKPEIIIGKVAKTDMDSIILQIINSDVIKGKTKKRCGIFDYKFKDQKA